jgi:hypothetical protein
VSSASIIKLLNFLFQRRLVPFSVAVVIGLVIWRMRLIDQDIGWTPNGQCATLSISSIGLALGLLCGIAVAHATTKDMFVKKAKRAKFVIIFVAAILISILPIVGQRWYERADHDLVGHFRDSASTSGQKRIIIPLYAASKFSNAQAAEAMSIIGEDIKLSDLSVSCCQHLILLSSARVFTLAILFSFVAMITLGFSMSYVISYGTTQRNDTRRRK